MYPWLTQEYLAEINANFSDTPASTAPGHTLARLLKSTLPQYITEFKDLKPLVMSVYPFLTPSQWNSANDHHRRSTKHSSGVAQHIKHWFHD